MPSHINPTIKEEKNQPCQATSPGQTATRQLLNCSDPSRAATIDLSLKQRQVRNKQTTNEKKQLAGSQSTKKPAIKKGNSRQANQQIKQEKVNHSVNQSVSKFDKSLKPNQSHSEASQPANKHINRQAKHKQNQASKQKDKQRSNQTSKQTRKDQFN